MAHPCNLVGVAVIWQMIVFFFRILSHFGFCLWFNALFVFKRLLFLHSFPVCGLLHVQIWQSFQDPPLPTTSVLGRLHDLFVAFGSRHPWNCIDVSGRSCWCPRSHWLFCCSWILLLFASCWLSFVVGRACFVRIYFLTVSHRNSSV